jgi:tRNA(fMet)-specific endonuclease VapC
VSEESPHPRGILDTSTVLVLEQLADARTLPVEPLITSVTLAELSVGPLVAKGESERVARQSQLQQAEADFDPLPFDASAARAFGRVAASLRGAGRKATARTYDAMIAATALANDLPVYTCNPTDFGGIDGLDVVAVSVPDSPPATTSPEQTTHKTAHDPSWAPSDTQGPRKPCQEDHR